MIVTTQRIQDWLCHWLGNKLGFDPQTIDPARPFAEYGLDSLAAVELSQALQEWLALPLEIDATVAWDYPTIQELAAFLAAEIQPQPSALPPALLPQAEPLSSDSAIAIVGMACRFPGNVASPADFWQLLQSATDAITAVPTERWNADHKNNRWGGFIGDVALFDADFFGISPREAAAMDPQQRLLLEVSWQSLEAAAIAPESLAGSRSGVFIGASSSDYARLLVNSPVSHDVYAGTGNALSILANRLSYLLDLRGPSLTIDTACSSSLVAVHQACLALRHHECDLALVGGVNLLLSPDLTDTFAQVGMMAADGRCKTFDARADGYVRSEGVGVVLLKRLGDAQRAGDPILALIQGSAVNQDGRSNGLTAPNGPAQQAVIRQALHNAGVDADQIDFVETHGTGTTLGDPIEVNALKAIFSERPGAKHCWLGAVKANIGHLEAAAGIASLIKTVLCLQQQEIPRQLHLDQINPHISLTDSSLAIPRQNQPWPAGHTPRFAGISSFGFGGTNAHLVLREAPAASQAPVQAERSHHIFTLAARSEQALRELAQSHVDFLVRHPDLRLADLCFTVNSGRNHFEERLAIVCHNQQQLVQALQDFALGQSNPDVIYGRVGSPLAIAFLFTGQGAQAINMGRQLYEIQPTFRQTLDQCAELLRPVLGISLIDLLYPDPETSAQSDVNRTAFAQPALFALEITLVRLWQSWGIEPALVLGHSVGELAAAYVAGAFTLEEGLRLVATRGQLMQALSSGGEMAAIFADEAQVRQQLVDYGEQVSLAAINGVAHTVISGESTAIQALLAQFSERGIESRRLVVSHAFHSPLLDPMLTALEEAASQIVYQPLQLPLITDLTGEELVNGTLLTAAHWRNQARQPVLFHQGLTTLLQAGYTTVVEMGPKPVLTTLGRRHPQGDEATWLPSLNGHQADWEMILTTLAHLYVRGNRINWAAVDEGFQRQRLALPTYRFQRKRYWLPAQPTLEPAPRAASLHLARTSEGIFPMYHNGNHLTQTSPAPILLRLQQLVATLLHSAPQDVAIHKSFLDMGADSIVLLEAVRRIEQEFGVKLQIRQFFDELSTLAQLAAYIEGKMPAPQPDRHATPPSPSTTDTAQRTLPPALAQQLLDIIAKQLDLLSRYDLTLTPEMLTGVDAQTSALSDLPQTADGTTDTDSSVPSDELPSSQSVPLSEAQQQLWFLSQMSEEASLAYNESFSLRLHGQLQLDALRSAMQTLVNRHEALRTIISSEGDQQHILPALPLALPILDFTQQANPQQQVAHWFAEESRSAFNLTQGPLFRVHLLKLAAAEHLLVMTAHHIIIDGASMAILLREVSELYSAACGGADAHLPVATPFRQHIAWQQSQRESTAWANDETYWLQRLSGDLPVLELPLDHARPPLQSYRGAIESLRLDGKLRQALQRLSQQQGCTLFMTLLAAYLTLLHRLSGQDDLIVGMPTAGRELAGGESIVGYCTHLLAIRSQLSEEPTFAQFLQQLRSDLLDGFQHAQYPFARLVNKLVSQQRVSRDLSLAPILSSTFNLTSQVATPPFHELEATVGPRPTSFVDHELSVNVLDSGTELLVDFEYNCDIFERATVQRIASHFAALLDAIVEDVHQPLRCLPLLTAAQRQQLLIDWNSTAKPFAATVGFHQLFEAQVAQTPDAVAVCFEDQQISYAQLNAAANGMAQQLRALGVGRDVLVALLTERSPDFMAAIIAIFKAGGAYLPLDVRAPAARQSQMLGQSRTPLLLISADFAAAAAEAVALLPADQRPHLLQIETLKQQGPVSDNLPLDDPHEDIGARLAYVIYTSGSTGLPKGAMVEQRGMINHLYAKIEDMQLSSADTVAQTAPQSFDISVWQFLSTLLLGGRVHIFPDEIAGDPAQLLQQTAQQRITILEVVPSLLRMMLDEAGQTQTDLSHLRWMVPTGEALPPNLARRWMTQFPTIPMINAYGPTECSDDVTHYPIFAPPNESIVNMPIGRPVRNMRMYILDSQLQPVPIGVAGELYVGGIGVGRGYIHDAERSALAFVPDPFNSDPAARLYKTGDKARYLADGNIEYLGRLDYQVKIRGFRIELGEIEAVLEQHPAVYQAVVVDQVDATGNKRLIAYVVPKAEPDARGKGQGASNNSDPATCNLQPATLQPATLRHYLNDHLPDYMIPSAFVMLDAIPLTPNGKTDRKALPAAESLQAGDEQAITPPRTSTESTLVDIWADVLHVPPNRVGIDQDFFELGGHSLLATQAASRIRQSFAVDLPLRTYFNEPTIAGLANWIDATRWAAQTSPIPDPFNNQEREIGELL